MKRSLILPLFLLLASNACNQNASSHIHKELCPRNEYSQNGVQTVRRYDYSSKNGEIDLSSRSLYYTEQYDSLGNLIYYKGKDSPASVIYNYKSAIRDEMDYNPHKNDTFTYKMFYNDTTLIRTSLFDEAGEYFAKIEHFENPEYVSDSVYYKNRLVYVRSVIKDSFGRDSIECEYNNKYSILKLELDSEKLHSYTLLEDGILRDNIVIRSRGYDYSSTHRFHSSTMVSETKNDENGYLIYYSINGNIIINITYDKEYLYSESIQTETYSNSHRQLKYTTERYPNLLIKEQNTYDDLTIFSSRSEYEYDYYPYSALF